MRIANVLLRLPVEITGAHSALAALLIAVMTLVLREAWQDRATPDSPTGERAARLAGAGASEPVVFMSQTTSVDYLMRETPTMARYQQQMARRKITGHKCPRCTFVYVPPKGYCPLCVVATGEDHEVVVEPKGTVTSFTVVDPSQYPGGGEKEAYVVASILLDGASVTIGQQRVSEIATEDVRTGLRVEAVWGGDDGAASGPPGAATSNAIGHWAPNREPDIPYEELKDHVL